MILKKLKHKYIWNRIFVERLCEPIHLNLISVFIKLFGNLELKIKWDLIIRQHHAYGIFEAAKLAKKLNLKEITIIQFGVANGAGLINIQNICSKISKFLDIGFRIYGFDNLIGLPKIETYKDHPDLYMNSDYPISDINHLKKKLNKNVELIIGNVSSTIETFNKIDLTKCPIGFVSFDLDLYSSTKNALKIFDRESKHFLSIVNVYFDDLQSPKHNSRCGALLAINEFNSENKFRFIEQHAFLQKQRIFQRARWINHMFQLHVLDHEDRNKIRNRESLILENYEI